jgi:type III secretion protein L
MTQPAPVYTGRLMRKPKPDPAMKPAVPVKSAEDEAKENARKIISEARERAEVEANKIVRNARVDAEQGAAAILDDANSAVTRRVIEMTQEAQKDLQVSQSTIAELVLASMRRILEGFDDAELVRRVVARGLSELRESRRITVKVPADDYSDVRYALWKSDLGFSGVIDNVEIDNRLEKGQLVLDTGRSQIDVGLESQLKVLLEHLAPEYLQAEQSLAAETDPPPKDEEVDA